MIPHDESEVGPDSVQIKNLALFKKSEQLTLKLETT